MTFFNGGSDDLDLIPESVAIGGTFRAFSNTSFYRLRKRIEEVIAAYYKELFRQFVSI